MRDPDTKFEFHSSTGNLTLDGYFTRQGDQKEIYQGKPDIPFQCILDFCHSDIPANNSATSQTADNRHKNIGSP